MHNPRRWVVPAQCYSGTSHNGLSKIQTASIQQTNNVPPIDFAIETIHFQPQRRTTSYLRTTDRTRAPKGQVAVQTIIASKGGQRLKFRIKSVEISIKFSTFSYSAVPRKYIIFFFFLPIYCFRVSARDHWLSFMQTTPLNVTLQPHNWGAWLASTSKIGTTSQQRTRILPPMCPLFGGSTVV